MPSGEDLSVWAARWDQPQRAWDQGGPHPDMEDLYHHACLEGGLQPGSRVFSAGCGLAHNEAFLAARGHSVLAIDAVPRAIAEARQLYAQQVTLDLRVADALSVPEEERGTFAAVFDRAMLCALQPENRKAYVQACRERLAEGGLFMGLLFSEVRRPEGPPFAVDESEAWHLFHEHFDLCFAAQASDLQRPQAVTAEWLCIWRMKPKGVSL